MSNYIDTIGRWGVGNIDLNNRIVIHNSDGSISTERSFSTEIDGREVLLPTIINGVVVTEERAINYYLQTGEYLGIFNSVADAEEYATRLHERQEWYYTEGPGALDSAIKDITTNQPVTISGSRFYFIIGSYDISKIIKDKGIKWTRNDIDSANAGRNLAGTMNRGRVCTKIKMEITCIPLEQTVTSRLLSIIYPEYVTVHYVDPLYGERSVQFYSNNVPTTFSSQASDGSLLWADLSFPLVER